MSNVSTKHEAPLEVLRWAPGTVLDLLRLAGVAPGGEVVEVLDSELAEARPSVRRADFVALLRDSEGSARRVMIVEVQRDPDGEKLFAWPQYVTYLYARHRVPVSLVVVAFDASVARWARKRREIGSVELSPIVLGPAELPEIRSVQDAQAHPELSMLTALARLGARNAAERARHRGDVQHVFEATLRTEDGPHRRRYLSLLYGLAEGALRDTLKKLLEAYGMGALEMICEEWKAEGKAEGKAEALLRVLSVRGLLVDAATETRIRETRDVALLGRWLERAVTAATLEDVLAD